MPGVLYALQWYDFALIFLSLCYSLLGHCFDPDFNFEVLQFSKLYELCSFPS